MAADSSPFAFFDVAYTWLQLHDAVDEPWVALDDAYWQFDRCKDHLVVCGSFTGFDDKASAELRARFKGASR